MANQGPCPHKFRRARSDEQREIRRQSILRVAAEMVARMPVAEISLNELSRRVGLAKSNVLRYFESREAVLLELLADAWRDWLARLAADLAGTVDPAGAVDPAGTVDPATPADRRYPRIAAAMATSLDDNRLFCELISVSSAVLERNVSPEVARRFKLATIANTTALADLIRTHLGEVGKDGAWNFAGGTLAVVAGIWPLAQPSAAMLRVYEDPEMAALRLDFRTAVQEMLTTLLAGCLVRWPAGPAR